MKNFLLLIILLAILNECQRNKVLKTHGISYLENREKLILPNETNKNDAMQILGYPATKGMTNDNLWIYIERTKSRGSIFKLGKDKLIKNNVLVLEFDKFGVIKKKDFFDKEKMQDLDFAKEFTENDIRKENFIYGFLSSIRNKMETRKK